MRTPARDDPLRGDGIEGSWVVDGRDWAQEIQPPRGGMPAPRCPVWIRNDGYSVGDHAMLTVRSTQRRYRDGDGFGYLTTEFHCWECGNLREGDGWHCPYHQTDYCMQCCGSFGRHYRPRNFYHDLYVLERTEYANLGNDCDRHLGHRHLVGVERTCNGRPCFVSPDGRGASVLDQLEDCKAKAQDSDRALNERIEKERKERAGPPRNPEGAHRPSEEYSNYGWFRELEGLRPENRDIRLWGWYGQLSQRSQAELARVLHYGKKDDFTKCNWFVTMGCVVTQLVRHGKRGAVDRSPHEYVPRAIPFEFYGQQKWMKIADAVRQPNCALMQVAVQDVIDYVRALDAAVDSKRLDAKNRRLKISFFDDEWYIRPYQGHSAEMEKLMGDTFVPGAPIEFGQIDCLFHGISSWVAEDIRVQGIRAGGTSAFRAHIHLAQSINPQWDNAARRCEEGVKGDAYVQIEVDKLLEYQYDGEQVKVWINDKGTALTKGAYGPQEFGRSWIRAS